jgi:hypothetical protein
MDSAMVSSVEDSKFSRGNKGSAFGHPTDILTVGEQEWNVNRGCQDPVWAYYSFTSRRKQEVLGRINWVGSSKLLLVLASRVILGSESLMTHDSVSRAITCSPLTTY